MWAYGLNWIAASTLGVTQSVCWSQKVKMEMMMTKENYRSWPPFFVDVFNETKDNLAIILDAKGCRERWLQAEFFRLATTDSEFEVDFLLKKFVLGRGSVDFSGEHPTRMIAELKIVGGNFLHGTKVFTGLSTKSSGNQTVERLLGGEKVEKVDLKYAKENSLFRDIGRLRLIEQQKLEKYAILVIPIPSEEDLSIPLARCLSKFEISNEIATEIERHNHGCFEYRIWKVM
jgi:hypothetical protein